MKIKPVLFVAVCGLMFFVLFDASAKSWLSVGGWRPREPIPVDLEVSGTLDGMNIPDGRLRIREDNKKTRKITFVITLETKFFRAGNQIAAADLKINEHVTVIYQNTDWMAKEVSVTPIASVSRSSSFQTNKPASQAKR